MVVSPKIGVSVINEIADKGINYVWFQPGTYNEKIIELAESKGLKVVYNNCVLVALG
jgi:predicted CoA-binding protein